MNEDDIRFYAQIQAILLDAEAIKVKIQGMIWQNQYDVLRSGYPTYTEADFNKQYEDLNSLANLMRRM